MDIIGRKAEMRELERYYGSEKPELLIVYGRRRVGKTYLIKEFFRNNLAFYFTGTIGAANAENLANFDKAITEFGDADHRASKSWGDAFGKLKALLAGKQLSRKVVFFDEAYVKQKLKNSEIFFSRYKTDRLSVSDKRFFDAMRRKQIPSHSM